MKRKPCPECGLKHNGNTQNARDQYLIYNCFLYSPNRTVEEENRVFDLYLTHINLEIDRAIEERRFGGR